MRTPGPATPALLSLLLAFWANPAHATTRRVPSQYPSIVAGLDAAVAGDTVLVACGTYRESRIGLRSGVVLRSEGGTAACAIIDARGSGNVMGCSYVENAVVEGFTLLGGSTASNGGGFYSEYSSLVIRNCTFQQNSAFFGGGMHCFRTAAEVVDCEFTGNNAGSGGGIMVSYPSAFTITRCTMTWNNAGTGGGAISMSHGTGLVIRDCEFVSNTGGHGGAVYVDSTTAGMTVTNCTFTQNHAGEGGGMFAAGATATVSGCRFDSNHANRGGGIACWLGDASTVENCTFTGNQAGADYDGGGGMTCMSSSTLIDGCIFDRNEAKGAAIWVYMPGADPEIRNCTFVRNTGPCASAVAVSDLAWATLRNCIIAFNQDGPAVKCLPSGSTFCWFTAGNVRVFCTDIWGNPGGDWVDCVMAQRTINGNLSANPAFCDSSGGDWHLASRSPCAPASQPECGLVGALDVGCWGATSVPPLEVPVTWGHLKGQFQR